MNKFDKMVRFLPGLYSADSNPMMRGVTSAWASEDDLVVEAVTNAKEQLYVKLAKLQYLDALGSNVGVFRPTEFNLTDDQYRELIPALSFMPKQVVPTIKKVLEVFFGVNNPRVFVKESNPNEIVIQIPSSVPALRRTLKGSHHFHCYSGVINSVDDTLKQITISLDGGVGFDTKTLKVDELAEADFGVDNDRPVKIFSNQAGRSNVLLQFSVGDDLSNMSVGQRFMIGNVKNYVGSFIPNPDQAFTLTKKRGKLNQAVNKGQIYTTIVMEDASDIPNENGYLVFNFGRMNEESLIRYFGRPNNNTLLIDPAYEFLNDHSIGEIVNVVVKPYLKPRINGNDYSVYVVGVEAARILAQKIVESIVASGVIIRWSVVDPIC